MVSWKLKATALTGLLAATASATKKQPNIITILTDDQDWEMNSLDYMPLLKKYVLQEGTLFDRHYCTVSICCPSRVNIWTGYAAHNSNVTDVFPPYGGYPKFVEGGLNDNWLPVHLQKLGYNTYYTGKLFNAHRVDNYNNPPVKGFNGSDFLLDPYTYDYWASKMSRNNAEPVSYEGLYSPDVVAQKAFGFLDEAALHAEPFFIGIAPVAPHANINHTVQGQMDIPKYHPRHAHLFKDYKIPRTANFNPDIPSGVSWVKDLVKLNQTEIEYYDEWQRSRLRSLQSVDEMIEQLVQKLEAHGILDNTYIFYTTDNGYHISQHRLPPGKECPFETDIHIPLAVRGPGVPAGHIAGLVSSHTDLTPTFLKLAGSDRPDLDGSPLPLSAEELARPESGEHVNVEFWGIAIPEGKYGNLANHSTSLAPGSSLRDRGGRNNTYKALRLIGETYNILYTVWCTGEREFYDLSRDNSQVQNLFNSRYTTQQHDYTLAGRPFDQVVSRLDSLLMVTKSCKAHSCRKPWDTIHPDGKVKNLKDALEIKYDSFYEKQPKVAFSSCPLGHLISEEGPQKVNTWEEVIGFDTEILVPGSQQQQPLQEEPYGSGHWSWWT